MQITLNDSVLTVNCNGVSLDLVRVPSGRFIMGSPEDEPDSRDNERPAHAVHVPQFYMGIYPVTQAQWLSVVTELPPIAERFLGDDLPTVNVWLEHAFDFCDVLKKRTGIPFRLPSEAEWEYACRAGTTTPYFWGDEITRDQANFSDPNHAAGLNPPGFSGVPNSFGLFDMHGNVWEWCSDTWHDDYEGAPCDGSAWTTGGDAGYHVQRGGSWIDPAAVCRSAFRVGDIARNSDQIVGLRICVAVDDM